MARRNRFKRLLAATPRAVVVGVFGLVSAAPAQEQAPSPLATTQSELEPFLEQLRRRSSVYRRAVLQFTCTESMLEEDVKPGSGDLRSRHEATYRYLLQAEPERQTVSEYREILAKDNVPVRAAPAVVQTSIPPPYLWGAIFDTGNSSVFRFEVLGAEKSGVTDTVVIAFEGLLSFEEGHRLGEWSGRIWVDRDRLNPIRVEAEPARQEATLEVLLDKYRRSLRLGGVSLGARPKAFALSLDFLVNRYGLSFPSQAIWRRQVVDATGARATERMVQRRFADYRFFDIRTDEIIDTSSAQPDRSDEGS